MREIITSASLTGIAVIAQAINSIDPTGGGMGIIQTYGVIGAMGLGYVFLLKDRTETKKDHKDALAAKDAEHKADIAEKNTELARKEAKITALETRLESFIGALAAAQSEIADMRQVVLSHASTGNVDLSRTTRSAVVRMEKRSEMVDVPLVPHVPQPTDLP